MYILFDKEFNYPYDDDACSSFKKAIENCALKRESLGSTQITICEITMLPDEQVEKGLATVAFCEWCGYVRGKEEMTTCETCGASMCQSCLTDGCMKCA
jgi:hypothetical protein